MYLLPKEIQLLILSQLPIPDKRNLIRTSKSFNALKERIKEDEKFFLKMIKDTSYLGFYTHRLNKLEKYTLEFAYYGYIDMIPRRYMTRTNRIFLCPQFYFNSAKKNFIKLCDILTFSSDLYNKLNVTYGAASGGHLNLLKWALKNGCSWDSATCAHAAINGHLEVLKWAHENGCDWNTNTCSDAALNGHLDLLKWARENGCEWDTDTCSNAALNGHLDVLKWLRENGCEWNIYTCHHAALNGHLETLKWARENGCDWNRYTCGNAALNGHIETLKWARENGCDWDTITCSNAAYSGHLDVLKWARENGCDWDAKTCHNAALNGHLEVLKWAHENGCELHDSVVFESASRQGHLEILKWGYENGYELDNKIYFSAVKFGHLKILKWACKNGIIFKHSLKLRLVPWKQNWEWYNNICAYAAEYNRTDIIDWIHQYGNRWNISTCECIVTNKYIQTLNCEQNGCEWNIETHIHTYSINGRHIESEYIRENDCARNRIYLIMIRNRLMRLVNGTCFLLRKGFNKMMIAIGTLVCINLFQI